MIPYPEKRPALVTGEALKHFTFIMAEDPTVEDEKKDAEGTLEVLVTVPTLKVVSGPCSFIERQMQTLVGRERGEAQTLPPQPQGLIVNQTHLLLEW